MSAVAVMAMALPAAAPAADTGAPRPDPRQLWEAYPLEAGRAPPSVRLPADSVTPARPAASTPGTADEEGGTSVVAVVGAALAALALGTVVGRRTRRRREPSEARESVGPWTVATAGASVPAPPPPRPVERARPEPPRPAPAPPPPRPVERARPEPPRAAPPPAPVVPAVPLSPRAEGRRFRRVPWPDDTADRWRCEITQHAGVLQADFRAVVLAPGTGRATEIARTRSFLRSGWGADPAVDDLAPLVWELIAVLRDAGWEPVLGGREWFAERFVWTRAGAPDLEPLVLAHATEDADDDR